MNMCNLCIFKTAVAESSGPMPDEIILKKISVKVAIVVVETMMSSRHLLHGSW